MPFHHSQCLLTTLPLRRNYIHRYHNIATTLSNSGEQRVNGQHLITDPQPPTNSRSLAILVMPPAGKGKGKKTRGGGNLGTSTNLHQRRSRSRNTSPSSATAVSDTTFSSAEMSTSYQDIVDRYLTADSGIPQAVTLHQLTGDLRIMQENVKRRLALYEESVRSLDEKIIRKQEDMKRLRKADDDAKERRLKAAEEARKGKSPKRDGDKFKKKKDRYERETDGKRPPAHGAHQLPTQHAEVVIPGRPIFLRMSVFHHELTV